MIRDAKAVDIPAMVTVLQAAFQRSHYAQSGLVEIDVAETKRLLLTAVQRHGQKNGGACFAQVAEHNGQITSLIIATLTRVYAIGNKLMASDLFWISLDDAAPMDAPILMRNMISWAWQSPAVIEVRCGATAVIAGDPRRAGGILEHLGMSLYGNLYRMEKQACPVSSAA